MHRASVVHRDIKPSNLFVLEPEQGTLFGAAPEAIRVKVADFGLAKTRGMDLDAAPPAEVPTAPALTIPGLDSLVPMGSPPYMAPEQFDAFDRVTAAADQYSLGILLFETLTGERPFKARTTNEYRRAHRSQIEEHLRVVKDLDSLLASVDEVPDNPMDVIDQGWLDRFARVESGVVRVERMVQGLRLEAKTVESPEAGAPRAPRSPGRMGLLWAGAVVLAAALAGFGLAPAHD